MKERIAQMVNDRSQIFLIAGPCVVESEELCLEVAEQISAISHELSVNWIFKASYKKANRSKKDSFTGIGDQEGLEIISTIRKRFDVPVLTDIHEAKDAQIAAKYVDILQIPAFLCRQTELLEAAADTGAFVNIKKGQFLAPEQMQYAMQKVSEKGNSNVLLTERGSFFGYQDLVVDFRSIPIMQSYGCPVIFDATHSLQRPNSSSGVTGGNPEFIRSMSKAAVAMGVNGLFIETHPLPENAKSDGANMLPLKELKPLLEEIIAIKKVC